MRRILRAKLFAGDAARGPPRIGAEKFQAAGLRAAESLHFEHDPVVRLFFDAEDAAREIASVGPEMDERVFSLAAKFTMQADGSPRAIRRPRELRRGRTRPLLPKARSSSGQSSIDKPPNRLDTAEPTSDYPT